MGERRDPRRSADMSEQCRQIREVLATLLDIDG
ncbi:MAG: hypothetical protein ACI9C1_002855 [Candidatus Aldehydirespiratoraceae bacterium]|jgi:hypothetical protein